MSGRFGSLTSRPFAKRRLAFWARAGVAGAGAAAVAVGAVAGLSDHPVAKQTAPQAPHAATPRYSLASAPLNKRYWMVASDGGIFGFPPGDAPFYGSEGYHHLNQPVVGMAPTPTGQGYWMVASDGGIFAHGDAGYFGSEGYHHLNQPVVGMAPTPTGLGYWMVASDGGIFTHGDAGYFGSEGYHPLNQPVVGMAATPTGKGYWLVAADGGIFTHGDAGYFGSEGYHHLNQPIVGMAPTPTGLGYWLVAADGGIFAHGDAGYFGSEGYHVLNQPVVGMTATPTGKGYWMVARDGGIFAHGDAQFSGSMGGQHLNQPIVGMAAIPELFASSISLAPSVSTVAADGAAQLPVTATVTDATGYPVAGRVVNFSVTTPGCGSLNPTTGVTDINGNVTSSYTSSLTVGSCTLQAVDTVASLLSTTSITQAAGAPSHISASPSGALAPYTADQGAGGITVTFTVTDAQGHPVPNVTVDFTKSAGLAPNGLSATSGPTSSSGVAKVILTDTSINDSGTVTGTVHGTNIQASTGTFHFIPGRLASLSQPSVSTQKAGVQYTVPINADDAYSNPVNPPTDGFTFSGTALDNPTSNGPTPTPTFATPFANGAATIHVTSLKAEPAQTARLTIQFGSISTHTTNFTVLPADPATVNGTPSVASQYDADTANGGIPLTFTVLDGYGNAVPGTQLDLTTPGFTSTHKSTSTPAPTGDGTGGSTLGVTTATFTDTLANDAGTVVATVHGGTVNGSTAQITIVAGALHTLTVATPAQQTAGAGYSTTVSAADAYGNAVNPGQNAVTITGSALAAAPDGTDQGQQSLGSFSGGQATLQVTSVAANDTAQLTATDGAIQGSTQPFSVKAGKYSQLVATSTSMVISDLGSTLFFQDPSGTPKADVVLQAKDKFLNNTADGVNSDLITVTLTPDGTAGVSPDGGTLTGSGAPTAADTSAPVSATVNLSGTGQATFTYKPPTSSVPTSGNGFITVADASPTKPSNLSYSPGTIVTTVTTVHAVNVGVAQTTFTADTGNTPGVGVSSYASDGASNHLAGVSIDFTTTGLLGPPSFSPGVAQTANPGPAASTLHAVKVGHGNVVATLRGAPLTMANLQATSPSVTVTVGSFSTLGITGLSPTAPVAGHSYTATVAATDSEGNPAAPVGTVSFGGHALDHAPNQPTKVGTAGLGTFDPTTEQATLTGTAYKAGLGVDLTVTIGSVSKTITFDVTHDAAGIVTTTVPSSCCSADSANNGIQVTVNVTDQWGNVVPSQPMNLTTTLHNATIDTSATPQKSNATTFSSTPVPVTTDSTGTAGAMVYDTTAGDTGTIDAAVPSSTVHNTSSTITITPGPLAHLSITTPPSARTAGTVYNLTVTATDAFHNAVNPTTTAACTSSSVNIACTGAALSPAPNTHSATATFGSFAAGSATLSVTSVLAAKGVSLTVTDGTVTASTNTYDVNPAPASNFSVTSPSSSYHVATTTLSPTTPGETDGFTLTMVDAFGNTAADHQGDTVHAVLTGGSTADGGSLTGNGLSSPPDAANTAVTADVTLNNGTGLLQYQAGNAAALSAQGTGTMTFSDTTDNTVTPTPTSISVTPLVAHTVIVSCTCENGSYSGGTYKPVANKSDTFTVLFQDQYGHTITSATKSYTVTIHLAPGGVPDGGTLNSTASGSKGPDTTEVTVDVTNGSTGTGTFTYTAPPVKPVSGSGTLTFTSSASPAIVFSPTSIAVSDS